MELPYDDFDEEHPPHLYRNRFDPWNNMSDIEFRKDFRFSKENLTRICELVREDLERTCDRSHSLTVEQQVSMCVHLLGRNVMQADAARLSGCNQSSVSRILHAFLDSMLKLKDDIITWPSEEERRNFAMTTLNEYRLPSITGYIDGTHIRIIVPTSNEPDYVNRKSYHSLNTMKVNNKEKAHKDHVSGTKGSEGVRIYHYKIATYLDLPIAKIQANNPIAKKGSKFHQCSVCSKLCPSPYSLKCHMRIHTERPCKCKVFGKRFIRSAAMTAHSRVHTGKKPFKCNVCGREFSQAGNLKQHLVVHSGDKPHKCDVCGKEFTQSSNLTVHLRKHSGDMPYVCKICRRKFSDSSNFKIHCLIHTGLKPWKCDRCPWEFVRWDQLKGHLKNHKVMNPCRESYVNTNVNDQTVVHVVSVTNQLSSLQVNDSADDSSRTTSNDISGGSEVSGSAQLAANPNQPSTSKTSIEVQRNAPEVDEQDDQELQSARDLHV